jgi:hypothetical protein
MEGKLKKEALGKLIIEKFFASTVINCRLFIKSPFYII